MRALIGGKPMFHQSLQNNQRQIRALIGLKPCVYLAKRLGARDFHEVIVDEAEGHSNRERII